MSGRGWVRAPGLYMKPCRHDENWKTYCNDRRLTISRALHRVSALVTVRSSLQRQQNRTRTTRRRCQGRWQWRIELSLNAAATRHAKIVPSTSLAARHPSPTLGKYVLDAGLDGGRGQAACVRKPEGHPGNEPSDYWAEASSEHP